MGKGLGEGPGKRIEGESPVIPDCILRVLGERDSLTELCSFSVCAIDRAAAREYSIYRVIMSPFYCS